jgi:hypothetical protein
MRGRPQPRGWSVDRGTRCIVTCKGGTSLRQHAVVIAEGGVPGKIQLALLLFYAFVSRLWHYRGMQRFSWLLGTVFSSANSAILSQGERKYKIYLNDGYWTPLLYQGFHYEEAIGTALHHALSDQTIFVDCGANNGYWSVCATENIHCPSQILAIEATRAPFSRLCENMKLNNERFAVVQRAVYSRSGGRRIHNSPAKARGQQLCGRAWEAWRYHLPERSREVDHY